MNREQFDYTLPRELIAQRPLPERDGSRLMILHRNDGLIEHQTFRDLPGYLRSGDLLVVNNSKVIPVSLHGRRRTGGKVSLLLLGRETDGSWRAMLKSNGKIRANDRIDLDGAGKAFRVLPRRTGKIRYLQWEGTLDPEAIADTLGQMPLPPYIKRDDGDAAMQVADRNRYQTVFAQTDGSVAAPTAGLHFTRHLLDRLADFGVAQTAVTLHVGIGTFAPITCEQVEEHVMHAERYAISPETAEAVTTAKREGRRVIAVGTTSARVLEAAWTNDQLPEGEGETDIYIYPPYRFSVVDAMITNFHLPRTSLLVMISALAGIASVQKAYSEAIAHRYRFFSYGDAMLIL